MNEIADDMAKLDSEMQISETNNSLIPPVSALLREIDKYSTAVTNGVYGVVETTVKSQGLYGRDLQGIN